MAQALNRMHMNCRECDRRFTTFFERNQNGVAVTPQHCIFCGSEVIAEVSD